MIKFITLILALFSMILALLIHQKIIPPISTEYLTARPSKKESLKNSPKEILLTSRVFFFIGVIFMLAFFVVLFPGLVALEVVTFIGIGLLLLYVIYTNITDEMRKTKN